MIEREGKLAVLIDHNNASVTMRSVTEARWSLFFEKLGYKWQYEPETFFLSGGIQYTPDFKIERFGWLEVKPTIALVQESMTKMRQLVAERFKPEEKLWITTSPPPDYVAGLDRLALLTREGLYRVSWQKIVALLWKKQTDLGELEVAAIDAALRYARTTKIFTMVRVGELGRKSNAPALP